MLEETSMDVYLETSLHKGRTNHNLSNRISPNSNAKLQVTCENRLQQSQKDQTLNPTHLVIPLLQDTKQ